MPSADPLCGRNERSCSSQQVAAAWAWFEHSGATCITPRRAEGIRGAPHLNTAPRPASRFRKEFLASSKLPRSNNTAENNPDSNASPPARQPRRHSFHGESVLQDQGCSITGVRPRRSPSSGKQYANFNHILGLNGDADHDFDRVSSTLLDRFELESVWRQVRHRTVNGVKATGREESTYSPSLRLHFAGHDEPPDHASSFTTKWRNAMRRGGSAHLHRPAHHGRSPSKDDHHQHDGTAPSFLHQLIRLGIRKSSSSPVLCSSVATANSIRDHHRMRAQSSSDRAKAKHQAKSSPQNPDAPMRSLGKLDQLSHGSAGKELDQHHYHNHRHIHHHHHHHHHHLLHHRGDGNHGKHGTPTLLGQKLQVSLEKELLKLLVQ